MMLTSNLTSRLFGGTRRRETRETVQGFRETEALWRRSSLAGQDVAALAQSLADEILPPAEAMSSPRVREACTEVIRALLLWEDIGDVDIDWGAVDADPAAGVAVRQMLARRRRWAIDTGGNLAAFAKALQPVFGELVAALPEAEVGAGKTSLSEVPLIELAEHPAELVERLLFAPYDADGVSRELFQRLRAVLERNLKAASGLPPSTDVRAQAHKLVLPSRQKDRSAAQLAEAYLGATPLGVFAETAIAFQVNDEVRFEHCHIVGGTGHGKTQLMQQMIHSDLLAAQRARRSVVVIDSQGDMIPKIARLDLFSPQHPQSLADRLILIDPADVEHPAALNLFDPHLDRLGGYSPADRERVLNGLVEVYETMFGDMLGAELTQKQGVVFRYLARLMITIPGATIHTLMQLMEDGRAFRPQMAQLEGSARYFFETEFYHPSFAATKKQILRRLWGVLSTPAFERMFAQRENKLDLFEATRDGKIVLISTAKDLLKRDGSALLGRFFINMLAQAALERSVLPSDQRTPTFVYVDEAHEYFDDGVETILQQARKYRIGLTLAHQTLDQASPRLRSALFSNTSFKCVGGVSAKDARALAEELHTTADFIERMRRRGDRTEFAAWVKRSTHGAVRLSTPLGHLERQPTLSEEAYDALIERNRQRYCGSMEDMQASSATLRPAPPQEPANRAGTEEPQSGTAAPEAPTEGLESDSARLLAQVTMSAGDGAGVATGRRPASHAELGKGGAKHRYLQNLIKGLAEQVGFRATIEAPVPGGQVDVLLEREGLRVAVEVSVTTPVAWERENLRKCLATDCDQVVLVLAKTQVTAKRYREVVVEGLSEADRGRLAILSPEETPDFISALAPDASPPESVVRGYKVKARATVVSPEEAKTRRETIARLVAQSMGRQ